MIYEPGLYSLAMHSRLPRAEIFQDKIYEVILPELRKFGQVSLQKELCNSMALLQIKDKEIEERKEKEQEMEVELKAAQEHVLILKDMLIKDDPITKTQIVYLSTSPSYALQNRFKVGGVESANHLTPRLRTYNSNRTVGDEQYFSDIFMVADYKNVEKRLESLVGRFRDKKSKEVYRMHYTNLKYIVEYLCERFDEDVDMVNEKLSTFIENLNTE